MVAIRAEVARIKPVLVTADSLGPACGAEPESADAAIRTLNALRSITPAKLVIAHVSKVMADQRGAARPFGSVFVQNLPRNVWELRKGEDEETENILTVGLYHRKSNLGRLSSPFGLQFEFAEKTIQIRAAEVAQDARLRERAGLTYSIRASLRSGGAHHWGTGRGARRQGRHGAKGHVPPGEGGHRPAPGRYQTRTGESYQVGVEGVNTGRNILGTQERASYVSVQRT